ncbi:MAG TPA: sigma-70 family RNA polymerase sigma factor [Phycisphaerae bacterium]|nr:sigma-70 family RNA polymerase sigma factor [Phycisphaerae bacterium]HNU45917.1 sigma-70 family RNA polymerase sigma factor [Phycisphaerae bacterium]
MSGTPGDTASGPHDLTPSLLVRLRTGDPQAGELLNRLYREAVLRFCFACLQDREEAEDALQDIFCRVLEAGQVPDAFRCWLYRVARNHCAGVLREWARHGRAKPLPTPSRLGRDATGQLTRLVRREEQAKLAELVACLPLEYREVLSLRYVEGLTRAEIAEVLEIPESLVKSRLFTGLRELRQFARPADEE